jgi:hypothetical protein
MKDLTLSRRIILVALLAILPARSRSFSIPPLRHQLQHEPGSLRILVTTTTVVFSSLHPEFDEEVDDLELEPTHLDTGRADAPPSSLGT